MTKHKNIGLYIIIATLIILGFILVLTLDISFWAKVGLFSALGVWALTTWSLWLAESEIECDEKLLANHLEHIQKLQAEHESLLAECNELLRNTTSEENDNETDSAIMSGGEVDEKTPSKIARDELITRLAKSGQSTSEIAATLATDYSIQLSERSIRRVLSKHHIGRRSMYDLDVHFGEIRDELESLELEVRRILTKITRLIELIKSSNSDKKFVVTDLETGRVLYYADDDTITDRLTLHTSADQLTKIITANGRFNILRDNCSIDFTPAYKRKLELESKN